MENFEQLGLFYLGKQYDLSRQSVEDSLVLYDSKDLTTHAVCVGMTGSGKTGLCLTLLEEAAIDGIPVIAIDPKGDIGNLLLTFPLLRAEDFLPWIDPNEAARQKLEPQQFAQKTAEQWKAGLANWGQQSDRIERFRSAVDLTIYTPGSESGVPLSLLKSFTPPPAAILQNNEAFQDRIQATVSGLLALINVDADPLTSREHILLSGIFDHFWRAGQTLEMEGLLRAIQSPPFTKLGLLDLESVFSSADRFKLSMQLNYLAASPGFANWMKGEPLDIGRLLHTASGKPRVSILSIAHLSDSERMFFVTMLLNEIVTWTRTQSGTSSLRAIIYMDEVFGYFPPTANPPSKKPMLTLLKQARAFGVVLATQNPVDLDYKGLSNTGTWFLGRLQTERDKARVLDGLAGASAAANEKFDRQSVETILSSLSNRVFLMHNVHDQQPTVFQTRWALSYLRGPLTRDQISELMHPQKSPSAPVPQAAPPVAVEDPTTIAAEKVSTVSDARPLLPPTISECFLEVSRSLPPQKSPAQKLIYRPVLMGRAKIHFTEAKSKVDFWRPVVLAAQADHVDDTDPWAASEALDIDHLGFADQPQQKCEYAELPKSFSQAGSYRGWSTELKNHLYRNQTLELLRSATFNAVSQPEENERDFRIRISQEAREQRDAEMQKLRTKYESKLATLQQQLQRAQQRVEREAAQASQATVQSAISFGSTILGALLGRKKLSATNINKTATAVRSAGRAMQQRGDVAQANESVEAVQERIDALQAQARDDANALAARYSPEEISVEAYAVRPKKTAITVDQVVLVWTPWITDGDGILQRAF
ncbi:MAG: ATP-binding protein [Planctomycetota bacterium]|nr:ATP-binding protein [Planctomycetota bacterium]